MFDTVNGLHTVVTTMPTPVVTSSRDALEEHVGNPGEHPRPYRARSGFRQVTRCLVQGVRTGCAQTVTAPWTA
jgi:hypothetical protein